MNFGHITKLILLPGRWIDLVFGLDIGLFVDGQLFALFQEKVFVFVKFDAAAAEKLCGRLDWRRITWWRKGDTMLHLLVKWDLPITRSG